MSGNPKTALVTGSSGQDGYYLCDLLLKKGYRVIGTSHSNKNIAGYAHKNNPGFSHLILNLECQQQIDEAISDVRPNEIYNLASYSSGVGMHDNPIAMMELNGLAPIRIIESIRNANLPVKFCQASSSEVFALAKTAPQNETTPHAPRNAYGAAKAYADTMVRIYREKYGLFCCSAILFNHESPLRREEFVTRKITRGVAKIHAGLESEITLGDVSSRRDWGYAKDYVLGMWLMMQSEKPSDYVFSTGTLHSVEDLCKIAFAHVGMQAENHVKHSSNHVRWNDSNQLVGDSRKAKQILGWQPSVSFKDIVCEMVDADISQLKYK